MKLKNKNSLLGHFIKTYGSLAAIILVMMVITSVYNPAFLKSSNLLQLLINNNTIFFAGLGMTFVIISGNIDLSQGALAALSTMILAWLINKEIAGFLAVIITLIVGALIGVINGVIVARGKIHSFIVTLGMTTILRGLAIALNSGYPLPIDSQHPIIALGKGKCLGVSNVLIIAFFIFIFCWFLLNKTNSGRDIYAVGGNAEAAKFSGINVGKTTVLAFVLSGTLTALAGIIMAARMYSGVPSCAQALETDAITAVIIGGTSFNGGDGNMTGAVFGTVLLAVLVNCMVILGMSEWQQKIISGSIIIVAVLYDHFRHDKK